MVTVGGVQAVLVLAAEGVGEVAEWSWHAPLTRLDFPDKNTERGAVVATTFCAGRQQTFFAAADVGLLSKFEKPNPELSVPHLCAIAMHCRPTRPCASVSSGWFHRPRALPQGKASPLARPRAVLRQATRNSSRFVVRPGPPTALLTP